MTAFKTNPVALEELLRHCSVGRIQLPDFQRGWVWDEERIRSLIASISQAFPVGALMTLEMKPGAAQVFARRPLEGAADNATPDQLLLDGQQRMTSLFQTCLRREVVRTLTVRNKEVDRWFYIDVRAALDPAVDRDDAVRAIPADKRVTTDFGRRILLDVSTLELEYEHMMFPTNRVFDWDEWQDGFWDHHAGNAEAKSVFKEFKNRILQAFKSYQVPVIALGPETSHAAVCLVFEKVNTGGKALDAFELVTAMYAAGGHRLRDDWLGTKDRPGGMQGRLRRYGSAADQKTGVLEKLSGTDMLQAVALLHGATLQAEERAAGTPENKLTPCERPIKPCSICLWPRISVIEMRLSGASNAPRASCDSCTSIDRLTYPIKRSWFRWLRSSPSSAMMDGRRRRCVTSWNAGSGAACLESFTGRPSSLAS